jgi:hypothetical protein
VVFAGDVSTAGSYSFFNTNAVAGTYGATIYGYIVNNASNQAVSLPVTATVSLSWQQDIPQTTTTYFLAAGVLVPYATPTVTIAPTTAATQLLMAINAVITPANSAGVSYVVTYLLNPSGVSVPFQYSFDGGATWTTAGLQTVANWGSNAYIGAVTGPVLYRYFDPAAVSGSYRWDFYGFPQTTTNGVSSYAVSWNATYSFYLPGVSGGNVYVLGADGVTQQTAINSSNVLLTASTPSSCSFAITNNAGSALTYTLAVATAGV